MRHLLAGTAAAVAILAASGTGFAQSAARPAAPAARAAAAPATPAPPPTAEERQRLVAAGQRGILLYEIARAGQLTTQDMLARVPNPSEAGITGWIAMPEGAGMTVLYYAETPAGPVAVYRGQVAGGRIAARDVFTGAGRPALTATQRRMAAARAAVATLDRQPCGGEFNVFVIPPATADAPIDVYKTTPQTQRGRFPLGGHFQTTVAADGTVGAIRNFSNRCLDLEVPVALAGTQPRPLAVTHLTDSLPTEIHVFLSLWMNRPLLVATGNPDRLWTISRGRIGIVGAAATTGARTPPPGPGR